MAKNIDLIDPTDPRETDPVENLLRDFFREKGFLSALVQHRPNILGACEDPTTIATYNYCGYIWPLPQTGQMELEKELLTKPEIPGLYTVTYSFRNESDPIPGRHNLSFPMFEFETHGDMQTLKELETELLEFLGFGNRETFREDGYQNIARRYGVRELRGEHEERLWREEGPVFFLTHFPQYTSPFWNMRKMGENANKIDVILYGIETIGSAERNTDPDEMRELFHTISDGRYAKRLYAEFERERVEEELEEFLALPFFPRCGGGIGMTRMIRAMKEAGILQKNRTTTS